eukprot:10765970-Lingulodinium_polyedra.AAC.1
MDEGSVGYAGVWFLLHHLHLRATFQRDVFHREWNDCKGAVKASSLWWVILCSTLVMNLTYGPWEGAGWFEKL